MRSVKGAFERLEPCAGKLASTVLRGGSGSNITSLPDWAARSPSRCCFSYNLMQHYKIENHSDKSRSNSQISVVKYQFVN